MQFLTQIGLRGVTFLLLFTIISCNRDYVSIPFDSGKEVSGMKLSLEDISPGLPVNWDGYEYVVLEFMITSSQRFQVGFTTETGYNELRVMNYTPNGWNRLAIPLSFYRELPAARSDLAATFNQPRYTGWINLTGQRRPLDEFGQYNLGDWEGKISSLEELQKEWDAEDSQQVDRSHYNFSKYGGYLDARIDEGTGFFRTQNIEGRWWFVDPEGYLFLSHGVNCVGPGGGGGVYRLEHRQNLFKELPPEDLWQERGRYRAASFGTWNLSRRYGEDYGGKSIDNIITRMDRWGLNTIANWSSKDVYDRNRKAFTLQMRGIGIEGGLMGLADVYAPDFGDKIDEAVRSTVEPYRDNPWLLGYFTFNEPSFLGREERLCQEHLAQWDTREGRIQFIHNTFRIFIETVDQALEKHDPNHLTLGIRFGQQAENDILDLCKDVFDVFSFNCYDLYPNKEMMDRFNEVTGKPLFIGEYHFGTVDRGMAQSLWQVNSQEERGIAYRYYTEKAFAHPGLIGTSYFQWCDQDLTGRGNDGENYNCGMVDVTDRPYPFLVEAVSETAKRLFEVHSGSLPPVEKAPARARGHHAIPDLWNE
jgi:hypothetical protein